MADTVPPRPRVEPDSAVEASAAPAVETSDSPQSASAGPEAGLSRGARAAQVLAVAVFCVVVMAAAVVGAGYGPRLLRFVETTARFVFQPVAIVFLVALAIEYLILKSADRSRLLSIELERLRAKRREEVSAMRRTHESLERLQSGLSDAATGPAALDRAALLAEVERAIESLRPSAARLVGGETRQGKD
jgi:hypothetical protein